jgi:hypothetical protein
MHPIFQIKSADIQALNDEQARELVARLCSEELRFKGVGTHSVTWGGDQRAKDGGVDVRVDITPAVGICGYIPKDATCYQVKAESFSPSKIPGEMAPKGTLRPAITEINAKSGAYIVVSTRDDLSDSSLKVRKIAMADCLQAHGMANGIHLDFYDSRKIADWTENFPGIVTWVRTQLGKPLDGWRPYGPWAHYETNVKDEYLLDDKAKVFAPDSEAGVGITSAIDRLRRELGKGRVSARIVGLSGVGKTRFVQALFDDRIKTENAAPNSKNVLYTDISHSPTPQPIAMLEALHLEGSDSVVVVDNCGQDIHQKLTEIVKRPDSKIRLVTVEYDIRDDLPEGTTCYRLEGSSNEVIAKLLKRRYSALSDIDVNKIVEFSDGNARVAFALASTSETKGEIGQLTDDLLFQRLFHQKQTSSDELLRCAEAASLLYSFDADDASEKSEMAILSSVSEVTITTFFRNISELQRRGLVQERGKWRAVLPHAISNRLALRSLETYPPQLLVQKFVNDAPERVARSFSRRLGFLHESKHARNITDEWLKPSGILGDLTHLDEHKRQMLENVAPVNQRAVLSALLRAVEDTGFVSISNRDRARFGRLLRSLAYEQDQFISASTALSLFALEESDDCKSDSSRDILKSLFYSHLSGTQASPEQRATFVRTLAFSDDEAKQKLALTLLRAGLESTHFSCHYGFEFGALRRGYGWYPKNLEDARKWYGLFIDVTVELGKTLTAIGADARALLGGALRGLWTHAGVREALLSAAGELAAVDGWPDGWIGVRGMLHWDKKMLDDASLAALKILERELAPYDLMSKIRANIFSRGPFGIDLDDDVAADSVPARYQKAYDGAEALGKAAALDEDALADLAPYISNLKFTDKIWHFGFGVGQAVISVQLLLDRIKTLIENAKPGTVNPMFIRGLIAGRNRTNKEEVSNFLDSAVCDDVWGKLYPELQLSIELDQVSYRRLIKSLEIAKAPCWQYQYLGMGRATDPLSVEQIATLLTLLASKLNDGLIVAIDVLGMVIHCAGTKRAEYQCKLRAYCANFVGVIDWTLIDPRNENAEHHLGNIVEFAFSETAAHDEAFNALTRLIQIERSSAQPLARRLGNILLPFFKHCPMEALEACYIRDNDGNYNTAVRILANSLDRLGDTPVGAVPANLLIEWCKLSPRDRFAFAARTCKLFEKSRPEEFGDESSVSISSTAQSVLLNAPDKKNVLDIFINRFRPNAWSGSLATIMRRRLQLLDHLNPAADEELQIFIEETKQRFSKVVASEEQQEQDWERSRTARFE